MQFTLIQYLSIIIPLIFLSFKTYFGSLYFIRKTYQSWKYETFINPNLNKNNNVSNDDINIFFIKGCPGDQC